MLNQLGMGLIAISVIFISLNLLMFILRVIKKSKNPSAIPAVAVVFGIPGLMLVNLMGWNLPEKLIIVLLLLVVEFILCGWVRIFRLYNQNNKE